MEGTINMQETLAGAAAPVTTAATLVGPTKDELQFAQEIRELWAAHQDGQAPSGGPKPRSRPCGSG